MKNQKEDVLTNKFASIVNFIKTINPFYVIGGCIVVMMLMYLFLFSGQSETKKENRELKKEIKAIQKERNNLKDTIHLLEVAYIRIQDSIDNKENDLDKINQKINQIQLNVYNSVDQLNQIKKGVNNLNKQIQTQPTIKRTGDSLLNSLKNKIKT